MSKRNPKVNVDDDKLTLLYRGGLDIDSFPYRTGWHIFAEGFYYNEGGGWHKGDLMSSWKIENDLAYYKHNSPSADTNSFQMWANTDGRKFIEIVLSYTVEKELLTDPETK